jgi:hypothetical protein
MMRMPELRQALIERVLNGDGSATTGQRHAAFDDAGLTQPLATLVDKVARYPNQVVDEDFSAALESGLSEDQVFELVVCAAIGQASRDYDAAIAALNLATRRE